MTQSSTGYRLVAWAIVAAFLYASRAVFAPVFLILLLAYFANQVVEWLHRRARIGRYVGIVAVFFILTAGYSLLVWWITPNLIREFDTLTFQLPAIAEAVKETRGDLIASYPDLDSILNVYLSDEKIDARMAQIQQQAQVQLPHLANRYMTAAVGLAGCMIISLMVLLYRTKLVRGYARIEISRYGSNIREIVRPIVQLATVVGRAMEAQAMIAVVNTILTAAGLLLLGVHSLAVLSVIVFFCSFIPVIGVFLSTVPMLMIALTDGGPVRAIAVIVMVGVVHFIEAYILNPIIYGRHLKLNPVLVIMVLYIGHHSFGVWGMVLGVPVAHYLMHDVIGLPIAGDGHTRPIEPSPSST